MVVERRAARRVAVVVLSVALLAATVALARRSDTDLVESGAVTSSGHGKLVFADDFRGSGVTGQRWNRCYWWGPTGCTIASNHESQWYLSGQVSQSGGALHLTAQRQSTRGIDGKLYPFRSGMVTTGRDSSDVRVKPKFAIRYGYIEAKLRVPRGEGLWPALWLLPASNGSRPEVDIAEIRGSATRKVSMHLHTIGQAGKRRSVGEHWVGDDLSVGWHVFALDWQPGVLRWLIDGSEAWRVTGDQVPSEPMYLVANLAVGGDWPGPPTAQTPAKAAFDFDYIKIWKDR